MSDKLWVSTRKGLFELDSTDERWAVSAVHHRGVPVSLTLVDPRDGSLLAALDHGHFGTKLQRSTDGGATWTELAAPRFPKDADASMGAVWALAAGGADQPGRVWLGGIPGGLFCSDDHGATWRFVDSLWQREERSQWFGGGADKPAIHTLLVDPNDSRHVTLGVSCGGVWQTYDDGATWALTATGMRAAYMPPDRAGDARIQDPHAIVACPAAPARLWCQHHNGVFRSDDAGQSWVELSDAAQPSAFGFPVAVHPTDPDTAWFVPAVKDEERIPVGGAVVVSRTRDGGRTFEVLREGLPQTHAYDLVYRHALDIDASGERLAFGSTTGNLFVTHDGGERWQAAHHHLPPIYAVCFG